MAQLRKVADNVFAFLDRASVYVGNVESERFSQEMFCQFSDVGLQSPIEDMFWVAVHAMCKAHYIEVNPENDRSGVRGQMHIRPQFKVEKYRVDFMMEQDGLGPSEVLRPLVIELDGHAFHDKDKRQRSYEKARDRALVRAGYRVLHFTGSDVVADPFKVAHEAMEMLGAFVGTGHSEYDPENPLGLD